MNTPLAGVLARYIRANGPLSVSEYMHLCLLHPRHGYYGRVAPVLGRQGDFVTAPEMTQAFGELLGIWLYVQWRDRLGAPSRVRLIELGPGRGTMMRQMLRAANKFPEFYGALEVRLIEASRTLRTQQQAALEQPVREGRVRWLDSWDAELSDQSAPVMLVAHEFLDALPVRHFVRQTPTRWLERLVDLDPQAPADQPRFRFVASRAPTPAAAMLPVSGIVDERDLSHLPDAIEVPVGAATCVQRIAQWLQASGGVALLVDYAKRAQPPLACTLRAVRQHRFEHVLHAPGEADLTADVDFALLERCVRAAVPHTPLHSMPQGEFLQRMGLAERMRALAAANPQQTAALQAAYARLVSPTAMGSVYRVAALSSPAKGAAGEQLPLLPFEQPDEPSAARST